MVARSKPAVMISGAVSSLRWIVVPSTAVRNLNISRSHCVSTATFSDSLGGTGQMGRRGSSDARDGCGPPKADSDMALTGLGAATARSAQRPKSALQHHGK